MTTLARCKLEELGPDVVKWVEREIELKHAHIRIAARLNLTKQRFSRYWIFHRDVCSREQRIREAVLRRCPDSFRLIVTDENGISSPPETFAAHPEDANKDLPVWEILIRREPPVAPVVREDGTTAHQQKVTAQIEAEIIEAQTALAEELQCEEPAKPKLPLPIIESEDSTMAKFRKSFGRFA